MIRDANSGRSKGVAYVEFYLPESVLQALTKNGEPLNGRPTRVEAVVPLHAQTSSLPHGSTTFTHDHQVPPALDVGDRDPLLREAVELFLKRNGIDQWDRASHALRAAAPDVRRRDVANQESALSKQNLGCRRLRHGQGRCSARPS